MEIYTIGFTKKKAEEFFELLRKEGIEQLIDVRINNMSQLAGFTKRDDFIYFLGQILGTEYLHEPLLAPTEELLKDYRSKIQECQTKNSTKNKDKDGRKKALEARKLCKNNVWKDYEKSFLMLMSERKIENTIPKDMFAKRTLLLCSEPGPENCHRRLVLEYLDEAWGNIQAVHL